MTCETTKLHHGHHQFDATKQQCCSLSTLCFWVVISAFSYSFFKPPVLYVKNCVLFCPQRSFRCPLNEDGVLRLHLWALLYLACVSSPDGSVCVSVAAFRAHNAPLMFSEWFVWRPSLRRAVFETHGEDAVFIEDQTE